MKFKYYLVTKLLFFTVLHASNCQFTHSFSGSKRLSLKISSSNEIYHSTRNYADDVLSISKFQLNGEKSWSKEIIPINDGKVIVQPTYYYNGLILKNSELVLPNVYNEGENRIGITKIKRNGNIGWSKLIALGGYTPLLNLAKFKHPKAINFTESESIVLNYLSSGADLKRHYLFTRFDESGNILKHLTFKDNSIWPQINSVTKLTENKLALIRSTWWDPDDIEIVSGSLIQMVDLDINPINSFSINAKVDKIISVDSKYYLIAQFYNSDPTNRPNSFVFICLNKNFEVVWSKDYIGLSHQATFYQTEKGFIINNYNGENADHFTRVDFNGNVLSSKLIPTSGLTWQMDISSTHLVHEASQFVDNFNSFRYITCTSLDLESEICFRPNVCIEARDYEVVIREEDDASLFLEEVQADIEVIDINIETRDVVIDYLPFCNEDFNGVPVPVFEIPETICIGSPISISNIQNEEAQEVFWTMPGSTIEESILSTPLPFSYTEPGTYTITQSLNYFGCTNEYTKTIVVIGPIEIDLDQNIILCDEEPYLINIQHDEAIAYNWDDGSSQASLLASTPDLYGVEVEDKYCIQNLVYDLSYFDYSLITLPFTSDTVICEQLPLTLGEGLDQNTMAIWSDGETIIPRSVTESNFYELTTSLSGCSTTNTIQVTAEDCSTQIYIPNSFSPNRDGINDTFYPFGDFFEIIFFEIYDRWGNIAHSKNTPWNGNFRSGPASTGIYIYNLKIRNKKLDTIEVYSGDFSIIR